MPNRSSKPKRLRPRDVNQLAKAIVDEATAEPQFREVAEAEPSIDPIRQAAAEMGRRGGRKGGKARAVKLTPEQRSEIARKAAKQRWGKQA